MKKKIAILGSTGSIGKSLIKILKNDKKIKIGVYPIEDSLWNDVGEWSEYKKSLENLIL